MKKSTIFLILLSFIFVFDSCKKEDVIDDPVAGPVFQLDKTMGYPGEALTVITEDNLAQELYTGAIGSNNITFYRAGNNLSFSVPNLSAGNYVVELTIDGEATELALQILDPIVISDVNQYLTDYFSETDVMFQNRIIFVDSMVANGHMGAATAANDAAIWSNIKQQANIEYSSMTDNEKEKLAKILESNKDWIDAIKDASPNNYYSLKSAECESLRANGQAELNNGNTYTAAWYAVRFKYCQAAEFTGARLNNVIGKAVAVQKELDNLFSRETLRYLLGQPVQVISYEEGELGYDEWVAAEMIANEEKSIPNWPNGEVKNVFTKIRFRSPSTSDIGKEGTLGEFATAYSEFISAYDDYVQHVDQALIWRPEFNDVSKVVNFDRFLSIQNVSNDEVILLNTQVDGDNWQVAFATDASIDQSFSYDIVYDDGHTTLSKTFQSTVIVDADEPLLPAVNTYSVTGVTSTEAIVTCNITSSENTVTQRGVCYSTSNSTPTTADDFETNGTGLGYYTVNLDVTPTTTYYVRAFATSSAGTAYGEVMSFTSLSLTDKELLFREGWQVVSGTSKSENGTVSSTINIEPDYFSFGTRVCFDEILRSYSYSNSESAGPSVSLFEIGAGAYEGTYIEFEFISTSGSIQTYDNLCNFIQSASTSANYRFGAFNQNNFNESTNSVIDDENIDFYDELKILQINENSASIEIKTYWYNEPEIFVTHNFVLQF